VIYAATSLTMGGYGGRGWSLPEMRRQLGQVALLERGQAVEQVLQTSLRIVLVEFGRLDQAEQHGRAFAGLLHWRSLLGTTTIARTC